MFKRCSNPTERHRRRERERERDKERESRRDTNEYKIQFLTRLFNSPNISRAANHSPHKTNALRDIGNASLSTASRRPHDEHLRLEPNDAFPVQSESHGVLTHARA